MGDGPQDDFDPYAGGHHARFIDERTPMHLISKTFQSRFLLVPCDELNDIILGVVGRAQDVFPTVALHAIAFMSNHLHAIATGPANELPAFMGYIKREISRRWGGHPDVKWFGGMWSDLAATALPTADSQVTTLKYVLSQGVKEDLVKRPQDWPGVQCVNALTLGRTMSGQWFDSTKFSRAKQLEESKKRPEPVKRSDFLKTYDVKLVPLPVWIDLDREEQQRRARAIVDEICREANERRSKTGAVVLGARAVMSTDRNVATPPPRPPWFEYRRRMIAWADARCSETREYIRRYWTFQEAFRRASRAFLAGELAVEFPERAFRPVSWRGPAVLTPT
jgi:REP element-mobilizing transposase RayT